MAASDGETKSVTASTADENTEPQQQSVQSAASKENGCVPARRTTKSAMAERRALHATPGVVGLAAFAVTTTLFQLHNFGWCGAGPSVTVGVFFGGIVQMIAGLQCYPLGEQFGYCAFTTYGAMWVSLTLLIVCRNLAVFPVGDADFTAFLFIFGFLTLLLTVVSFCHHAALFATMFCLLCGFYLLTMFHWLRDCPPTMGHPLASFATLASGGGGPNASACPAAVAAHVADAAVLACEAAGGHAHKWAKYTAAVALVLSSAGAFYMMFEVLVKECTGVQLPLGPRPADYCWRQCRAQPRPAHSTERLGGSGEVLWDG